MLVSHPLNKIERKLEPCGEAYDDTGILRFLLNQDFVFAIEPNIITQIPNRL